MSSIKGVFIGGVGEALDAKFTVFGQKTQKLNGVLDAILPLEIIIGDAVVLWRA
ncbi:hypothetical protein L218DRAFT_1005614 [Marasmius fiardii PR-910]|nr:hypothetical protein L218DRAFT_1005614 [Marasmius fiardii PR-910]